MRSLVILAFVFIAFSVRAQIHSAAFDPNCYQPQIGVEIDTVVGATNGQRLGNELINIGPSPENPGGPGRLMMYGLPGTLGDTAAAVLNVGSAFNSKKLDITKMLGFKPRNPVMGHFRSKQRLDMLLSYGSNSWLRFPRIYWQKDDGTFDTASYTDLIPELKLPLIWGGIDPPYHAHLSSDTVEDIIIMYNNWQDSEFVCRFAGGEQLFRAGKSALPEEKLFYDSSKNIPSDGLYSIQGDFRGTGREDLIVAALGGPMYGRFLYFKNDPVFTLDRFVQMKQDTFLVISNIPWVDPNYYSTDLQTSIPIRMREGEPQSLALLIDSTDGTNIYTEERIFQGGPTFGSRVTLNDALVLHAPSYVDGSFRFSGWGESVTDCGDMTGTGDHVLGVTGGFGGDAGFATFYVLGSSFDEKADMYIELPDGPGMEMDSATLDGDHMEDAVISVPLYPDLIENGIDHRYRGMLLFVHGTTKIPHKDASVTEQAHNIDTISVVRSEDGRVLRISGGVELGGPTRFTLRDILGRTIYDNEMNWENGVALLLPRLARGTYILQVTIGEKLYQRKLAIM